MTSESGQMAKYDIAVVGAGPAGTACATLLGRAGFGVLLCDKAVFPRHKICGETVNPVCWESFERLGVAEDVAGRIRSRIVRISVTNGRGKTLEADISNERGRPFFAMGRDSLDHILARTAEDAGVDFRDGATVGGITWEGCWRIEVRDLAKGEKTSFTAAYLVGADGRNSAVARHLLKLQEGPGRNVSDRIRKDRVGVQWHAASDRRLTGALHMVLFDQGYCGLVDVDGSHTNVAMVTTPELAATARADFRGFLSKTLWTNVVAAELFPDLTPTGDITATSPINPRCNTTRHPHATLVGDANETVEPFTGEGIRMALEDGIGFADWFIAKRRGTEQGPRRTPDRFRVNRVFSPVLRRPRLRDGLISVCVRFPRVGRTIAGRVIPGRIGEVEKRATGR
jgi:flavin-dependent dehydrogenase